MRQERGFPDINIVMEKVAFDGITRFEDRERMPLGAPPQNPNPNPTLLPHLLLEAPCGGLSKLLPACAC